MVVPAFDFYLSTFIVLFAVLDSKAAPATLWNSEVYKQALLHETTTSQNPSDFETDPHLTGSATLRVFIDAGTVGAFDACPGGKPNRGDGAGVEACAPDAALSALVVAGGSRKGVRLHAGAEIDKVGGALQNDWMGTTSPIDSKEYRSAT